jgi:hypothetical protein
MIDDLPLHVGEVECIGGYALKSRTHAFVLWIEFAWERDLRSFGEALKLAVCLGVVRDHELGPWPI